MKNIYKILGVSSLLLLGSLIVSCKVNKPSSDNPSISVSTNNPNSSWVESSPEETISSKVEIESSNEPTSEPSSSVSSESSSEEVSSEPTSSSSVESSSEEVSSEPSSSIESSSSSEKEESSSSSSSETHKCEYTITTVIEPTCTEDGFTRHECICGNSYDTSIVKSTGHSYTYTILTAPTLIEGGTASAKCSKDSKHNTQVDVPKLSDYNVWSTQVIKQPKCEETGRKLFSSIYGDVYTEIPATGHTEIVVPGTASTCITHGVTDTYKCKDCDKVFSGGEELPLGEHVFGSDSVCECGTGNPKVYFSFVSTNNGKGIQANLTKCDVDILNVPSTYNGYPVQTLMINADASVKKLYIPNSVNYIFNNVYFDGELFTGCEEIYFDGTEEEWLEIKINPSYTTGFINLIKAKIYVRDENGEYTDSYDKKLIKAHTLDSTITDLYISNDVKYSYQSFNNFTELENVYFEGTLQEWCEIYFSSLYSNPMYNAKHLYLLNEENEYYEVINLVIPESITELRAYTFSGLENLKSVTLHDEFEVIGGFCFANATSLNQLNKFKSVTTIKESAFMGCTLLFEFVGFSNLTTIGNNAFKDCTNLVYVEILNGLETIGSNAFQNCTSLDRLYLPATLTKIEANAFKGCTSLKNVYYRGTIENWCNISFPVEGVSTGSYAETSPMAYASHFYMLENDDWEEVLYIEIPSTITSIGYRQFYGFTNLYSICIPSSVTSIDPTSFETCYKLCEVYNLSNVDISTCLPNDIDIHTSLNEESNMHIEDDFVYIYKDNIYSLVGYYGTSYEIVLPDFKGGEQYEIASYAFYKLKISKITVPRSLTKVCDNAFLEVNTIPTVNYLGFSDEWKNIDASDVGNKSFLSPTIRNYRAEPIYFIRGTMNDWNGTRDYGFEKKGSEYFIEITITSGQNFKIVDHMTSWNGKNYGYWNVEEGCKSLVSEGENGNIVIKSSGTYHIYLKPNTNSIWIHKAA